LNVPGAELGKKLKPVLVVATVIFGAELEVATAPGNENPLAEIDPCGRKTGITI